MSMYANGTIGAPQVDSISIRCHPSTSESHEDLGTIVACECHPTGALPWHHQAVVRSGALDWAERRENGKPGEMGPTGNQPLCNPRCNPRCNLRCSEGWNPKGGYRPALSIPQK